MSVMSAILNHATQNAVLSTPRCLLLQLDYLLIFAGTVCAAAAGVVMPLSAIVFGDVLDAFHQPNPGEQVRTEHKLTGE